MDTRTAWIELCGPPEQRTAQAEIGVGTTVVFIKYPHRGRQGVVSYVENQAVTVSFVEGRIEQVNAYTSKEKELNNIDITFPGRSPHE